MRASKGKGSRSDCRINRSSFQILI